MKTVLISIQPKWVEKICNQIGEENGKPIYEKVVEVRKSRPKLETPFKCYIYCTKAKEVVDIGKTFSWGKEVIGEFVCDRIDNYECELWNDKAYELIRQFNYDEYGEIEYEHGAENNENCEMLNKACLTWQDIRKYLGQGLNTCYAWHISDLKIYDKPKELSEFYSTKWDMPCEHKKRGFNMDFCMAYENGSHFCKELNCEKKRLSRPPQSWCYV